MLKLLIATLRTIGEIILVGVFAILFIIVIMILQEYFQYILGAIIITCLVVLFIMRVLFNIKDDSK